MKRNVVCIVTSLVILALIAACATPTPVIKEVTKVVQEVVKETVVVEGTPQVVETQVTKVVKEIVEVEKIVEVTPTPEPVYKVLYWEHGPWTREPVPGKEEDFVRQYIVEHYNLDIEIQAVPEGGAGGDAKLTAMIAAGEIPDFIEAYWGPSSALATQLVDQGVLIPIDDYLEDTPYLQSYLTEDEWVYLTFGGQKYGVAQPRPFSNWNSLWIRQDWLDKLGLERPTTIDELAEVALAFTTQDPDGNGQNDTYGFSGQSNFGNMPCYFAPFGAYPGQNHILVEDNQVVFDGFSTRAKDALTWWHAQIEAGVVDPDWLANTSETWRDTMAQGKVGIPSSQFQLLRDCGSVACMGQIIAEGSPEAVWDQLHSPQGPFGAYANWKGGLVDVGFWFTLQAASEPGKMEAIMRFFNDAMNPDSELYHLMVYGKPGLQYQMDAEGRRTHRFSPPGLGWFSYWLVTRRGDEGYFWYYKNEPNPYIESEDGGRLWDRQQFSISEPEIQQVTPLVAVHERWPDLEVYMQEMHMKFATGEEPLENWDAFVETAKSTFGLQEIMDDATAQLTALGVIQ
jgi:putative aldouronate transport system substrate-binding protein